MQLMLIAVLTLFLGACATMRSQSPTVLLAYIANFDTPRRDNMDANGKTALDGIGASIAQISP
jgi:hypothetical protein